MSSSHQPIFWDSLGQTLAAGAAYRVNLPIGTTEWRVVNTSGGTIGVAGTAASIATAANVVPCPSATSLVGQGQSLFLANGTGGGLTVVGVWARAGRQPDPGAGTASFTTL